MSGHGFRHSRTWGVSWFLIILLSGFAGTRTSSGEPPAAPATKPADQGQEPVRPTIKWDLVVLGRVEACFVCQHGPPPHVRYTRVLAGTIANGTAPGELPIVEVAARLLKEGGIPIYKSQREEICYLQRVALPRDPEILAYKLVDVEAASGENLAKFGHGRP